MCSVRCFGVLLLGWRLCSGYARFSGGLLRLRVGITGGGFGISFLGFGGYASSLLVYIVCWYGFWVAALGVVVVGVAGW